MAKLSKTEMQCTYVTKLSASRECGVESPSQRLPGFSNRPPVDPRSSKNVKMSAIPVCHRFFSDDMNDAASVHVPAPPVMRIFLGIYTAPSRQSIVLKSSILSCVVCVVCVVVCACLYRAERVNDSTMIGCTRVFLLLRFVCGKDLTKDDPRNEAHRDLFLARRRCDVSRVFESNFVFNTSATRLRARFGTCLQHKSSTIYSQ